ncbi:hypothetical protein H4Q26_001264 [Puccinia striiformis f. sp. tritici PST-130]|nr:hypothetical protein H4Q26_001264 [Puccinia striiformis f. sp. tritici PST-130]
MSTSTVSRFCNSINRVTSSIPYIAFSVSFGLMVDMATYGIMVPVSLSIGIHRLQKRPGHIFLSSGEFSDQLSWLIAAFAFGLIISSIPIGIFGEVVKSRKAPLLASLGFLTASLIMFWQSSTFAVLMVARIVQGFSGTAIWTLGLALICDVVPEARIGLVVDWNRWRTFGWWFTIRFVGLQLHLHFALVMTAIDFFLRSLVQDKKCIRNRQLTAENEVELSEKSVSSTLVSKPSEQPEAPKKPSAARALLSLLTNSRIWTICAITFVLGFAFGGLLDTGMTIPLAGHYSDKYGAKWPIVVCLILGTPFFGLLSMKGSLAAMIVYITFTGIFIMAMAAPLMQDLAEVVFVTPGLGFSHVYGVFNMVYSTGAMVGPLCVGALLDHSGMESGWEIFSLVITGLFALCVIPAWFFLGGKKPAPIEAPVPTCDSKLDSPV